MAERACDCNFKRFLSGTLDEYNSDPHTVSGTLSISADGVISSQDIDPDFRGVMDSGKTVVVGTATWDEWEIGTTYISVWLKKADSYPSRAMPWLMLLLEDDE